MEYAIVRSRRRSIAIQIKDGVVLVRAPLNMAKGDIDAFVASKERWVSENLRKSKELAEKRNAFTLSYGDMVRYRGKEYPIKARGGNRIGFRDEVFYMPPNLPPEDVKYACVQIYRMLAKCDLPAKALHFAGQMGVTPANVKINGAKTRWGSCSGRKSINFSWRLVMADDDVIDYVVVHELAHLTEMNHSKRFWEIVEAAMPDFRIRKAQLQELQKRLSNEDWD